MERKLEIIEKENGVTLVALVITIVVLIILAVISINAVFGESGLLNYAKKGKEEYYEKAEAKERLEMILADAYTEKHSNKDYDDQDFLNEFIYAENPEVEIKEDTISLNGYKFELVRSVPQLGEFIEKDGNILPAIRKIQIKDKLYSSISVEVIAIRTEGQNVKYRYSYKKKIDSEYQQAGESESNTFKFTGLKSPEEYSLRVELIVDNNVVSNRTINVTLENNYSYVTDGLILHFDGENNSGDGHDSNSKVWKDLSDNNKDGELRNFSYSSTSGWAEDGLKFDGVDDGIYLYDKIQDLLKDDFTIEMCVKCDEIGRGVLISNYSTNNDVAFEQYNDKFRVWWNNGIIDRDINNIFNTDKEMNISITLDKQNQTLKLYKDGKLINNISDSLFKSYMYNFQDVKIGRDYRTDSTCFKGTIHSVRIYNRELMQEDIENNYNKDMIKFEK